MYLLETSYRTSKISKLDLFTKKVNGLNPKKILAKSSALNIWKGPK